MADQTSGVARYENVPDDYLQKRKLRKSAGWILLWALGVGAVISGDFYGWHFGLSVGGFWGLAAATVLMAIMYVCMVYTIAELSAALPHAGGFFSFTRNAFGPTGGYICGLTDTIEYVITPAVIVVGIGGYMDSLVFEPGHESSPWISLVWWLITYAVFTAINIRGVELTLKVGLVITAMAVAVLVVFYVGTLVSGEFDPEKLFNIPPDEGHSADGLPFGIYGIFAALPSAIWFYLAIEQLPLAAEEAHNTVKDMPKALILGIAALLLLSLLTLVLNTGVGGGAIEIGSSKAPLADGFEAIFGSSTLSKIFMCIALTGFFASFHTIIFAYGRVLFALSRAGYFPRWISLTGRNHTPYVALLLGAGIGLLCAMLMEFTKTEKQENSFVGASLLTMAVFGAVISYLMVMLSYIKLKITRPDLPRPYRSPLGIPGAVVGAILSIVALCATFADEELRRGVWGVAAFLVVGMLYFFFYSRHRLVAQAPEEEDALIAEAEQDLAHH
jgi:ethanolamine permease